MIINVYKKQGFLKLSRVNIFLFLALIFFIVVIVLVLNINSFNNANKMQYSLNTNYDANKTSLVIVEIPPLQNMNKEVDLVVPEKSKTLKDQINSFIYQLQEVNFQELKQQNASLIVVEPNELTTPQINELQNKGTMVLSYLSIGEAEKWRAYWQTEWNAHPPFWVGENQAEKESLVVKYWEEEWQNLTFSRINEIILLGYDGFVLDTVSTGYHYWEERGMDKNYTRAEMVKFVKKISAKAKEDHKLVFVNNAGSLLNYEGYLEAIDGMTSEEAFYYNDTPATWSTVDVSFLDKVISSGKPVLALDYSTKKELQCDFITKAKEHSFVPFITTKGLDKIVKVDCDYNLN